MTQNDKEEVREFVRGLFARWREINPDERGDGIAAFAREARVPDGSLRVWLGRAGPKKAEAGGGPSAVYLIRMLRTADALSVETPTGHPTSLEDAVALMVEQQMALTQEVRKLAARLQAPAPADASPKRRERKRR